MRISNTPMTMDEFKNFLKKNSLKATKQRMAVHEAMLEMGHASADMVAESISAKGEVKVTVASVYNILTSMALLGAYEHRLSMGNKMYFDVNTHCHLHLYDTVNNEFKDLEDNELMDMINSRLSHRKFRGYKVDGVDIQILCHPSKYKKKVSR